MSFKHLWDILSFIFKVKQSNKKQYRSTNCYLKYNMIVQCNNWQINNRKEMKINTLCHRLWITFFSVTELNPSTDRFETEAFMAFMAFIGQFSNSVNRNPHGVIVLLTSKQIVLLLLKHCCKSSLLTLLLYTYSDIFRLRERISSTKNEML